MSIYFDNAATTRIDGEVFNHITPYLIDNFGNPSSAHQHGRAAKQAIEQSRETIAGLINASPTEIIFTSGGTEADNTAILSGVRLQNIKHVITTPFEHHAVLNTLKALQSAGEIELSYINIDDSGNLDHDHLEYLLQSKGRALVSVMHANNEIGNINNIELISEQCCRHNAIFHTDTVQTMGHYRHDLKALGAHFIAASAHKFHGPKGIGFLYCRDGVSLEKLIHGGSQERRLRAGTENIPGIVGLAKALEVAYSHIDAHADYVQSLKSSMIHKLTELVPGVQFNGNSASADKSLYTVLSAAFPLNFANGNLIGYLDDNNISVSGGSACSAGSASHVLQAIAADPSKQTIRFSFSKYNTIAEVEHTVNLLAAVRNTLAA
ncbi:cysteine desulfurase [Mucilaginibacter sp. UR6-1]|uniref:cysteine desulfurase family protein n=1 Tax=Mucilaginibacter sp. UR6-1 TaxID=1435643 RepID=UPI001E6595AB|nr:cysteine desulfurase family protein [Mucilaginibacter sp. UR6-1]MCC8407945.1 cysteine desulfurase [Mucilaginibacter sp. UR6-1]